MGAKKDLSGMCFGRLGVLSAVSGSGSKWDCICSCGVLCVIHAGALLSGHTRSCGCLALDTRTKHGMCSTLTYCSWQNMLCRCFNPKHDNYSRYGGAGITVCDSWLKFENFYKDMGDRPSKDHSIGRIDGTSGYCKENCCWETRKEQANNISSNRLLTLNGVTRTTAEWADELGVKVGTLRARLCRGWSDYRTLTEPVVERVRRNCV